MLKLCTFLPEIAGEGTRGRSLRDLVRGCGRGLAPNLVLTWVVTAPNCSPGPIRDRYTIGNVGETAKVYSVQVIHCVFTASSIPAVPNF